MNQSSPSIQLNSVVKSILLNIIAVTFIFFVPALSHMLSVPLYLIEPMRVMLILAMVHTNRSNAYILALGLPLFSFLVSSHPVAAKMVLIAAELSLNVFLFYLLRKKTDVFLSVMGSVVLSKLAYYIVKFAFLQFALLKGGLVGIPIYMQVIMTLIFSTYAWIILRNKVKN